MAAITGTQGWYEKYIKTLKGNCKWCEGERRVLYTSKRDDEGKLLPPHIVECPRCGGTGDEPDLGRSQVRIHA